MILCETPIYMYDLASQGHLIVDSFSFYYPDHCHV